MVHHPADGLLVARNFTRREHHDVLRLQPDVPVVVDGDPRERRLRLPLGAGAQAHDVLRREVPDVAVLDLHARRDAEIAQPLRDLRVVDHAAADERDPPVELRREVDDDLHPVDARRERRDDNLAVRVGEDLFEGVGDLDFGAGEAAPVDVGAVGQQGEDARRAELRQPVHVDALAVDRRLVDLEVAGVDDHAVRRLDGQRDAVGDAVRDAKELDGERADRDALARPHPRQPAPRLVVVVFELRFDERQGERRAVDRPLHDLEDVRHRADVVLVAVGEHDRGDLVLLQLPQVRDDEVHAEQLRLGEHHAGVDEDGGVAAGDHHHVHAELAQPPSGTSSSGASVP